MIDYQEMMDNFNPDDQDQAKLLKNQIEGLNERELRIVLAASYICLQDRNKLQVLNIINLIKSNRGN